MNWEHKCSLAWMKARQRYLTASDIKELLPVTPTGRARKVTDENYLRVFARKNVCITEDDCVSTGAAARGHILEPYAIETFNIETPEMYLPETALYHWDDIVVPNDRGQFHGLAFSPDGCDIAPPLGSLKEEAILPMDPKCIVEVKSYGAEKHLVSANTDMFKLEERWQIAAAMATRDSIEYAYLLFFHPGCSLQLAFKGYTRDDLEEEISIVKQIEQDWLKFLEDFVMPGQYIFGSINEEQKIHDQYMRDRRLNP